MTEQLVLCTVKTSNGEFEGSEIGKGLVVFQQLSNAAIKLKTEMH